MGKLIRFARCPGWRKPRYRPRLAGSFPKDPSGIPFWLVLCLAVPVFAVIGAQMPSAPEKHGSGSSASPGISNATDATLLRGRASIVHGDTFVINEQEVRLSGIDAPEATQRCTDSKGKQYRCGAWLHRRWTRFSLHHDPRYVGLLNGFNTDGLLETAPGLTELRLPFGLFAMGTPGTAATQRRRLSATPGRS